MIDTLDPKEALGKGTLNTFESEGAGVMQTGEAYGNLHKNQLNREISSRRQNRRTHAHSLLREHQNHN